MLAPLLGVLALSACNNRQSVVVPNRVLDRPTDMVLTCMRSDESSGLRPTSLEQCVGDSVCEENRLIGFVTNSERDEVAMFSRCANAVLDMDPAAPGAQLIPVGKVPTSMTLTSGDAIGCFAVTANLGSCDLSLLDVPALSAYAFDAVVARDPGELVSAITPTRGDGRPLGARPGQVLAVPPDLSNSLLFDDLDGDTDTDTDGDDGAAVDTDTGGIQVSVCDADKPGSVYVTFPSCQLIAEVDLRTQRILQSRQFVTTGGGTIQVIDTGVDPSCPIDCPEQFADDPDALLPDADSTGADASSTGGMTGADTTGADTTGDADTGGTTDGYDGTVADVGMYPSAMALISPAIDQTTADEAEKQIKDHALYVGGLGADILFELRYDGRRWVTDPLALELQNASGISAIRPTPAMSLNAKSELADDYHQFLYIIAGDGSTRVVRRNFDEGRTEIGIECDTQVDPTTVLEQVCYEANFPGENPPDRRPFARGPGIRGPNGSLITDWAFQKIVKTPDSVAEAAAPSSPFGKPGVTGVGTTSFGTLVFVSFDQFNSFENGQPGVSAVSTQIDPLGLLDATIQPHMLWPQLDPRAPDADPTGLPRVEDAEPVRLLPGNEEGPNALKVLAPALRRIDLAYSNFAVECDYAEDDEADDQACKDATGDMGATCTPDGQCLGSGNSPLLSPQISGEGDKLGNPNADEAGGSGLYTLEAVRAVVRDYRTWVTGDWKLSWEGEIPDTLSGGGQYVCETPNWSGGTCLSSEPGDTRVVDSAARFCDKGVLAGDKLQLYGCATDADCGVGQFCLVDPRTPANGTGICVSQTAYAEEDTLRAKCEDLIYDPCGSPVREYLITAAYQDELWLQSIDRNPTAYLMYSDIAADDPAFDEGLLCSGEYLRTLPEDAEDPSLEMVECEQRLKCAPEQPESGCETHDDCLQLVPEDADPSGDGALDIYPLCIDGLCRRVCTGNTDPEKGPIDDCVLRRLPGPECLRELVRYTVLARNSFVVGGPGAYDFLDQRVRADANGECYEDPTVSNLLTSRIRLGSDEYDTRNNTAWPIPTCPSGSEKPGAGAPNPCFIDTRRPANLGQSSPEGGLFHYFDYGNAPVPAIRYSNPMMSLVLDLTSLQALTEPVPDTDLIWPAEYREFRRSRIPRNFSESFKTLAGYSPYNVGVVTSSIALVGPTKIINAPEAAFVFIVDTAGGTGTSGVRGQVVRVGLTGGQVSPDVKFLVH